jgi:hypothetical protein
MAPFREAVDSVKQRPAGAVGRLVPGSIVSLAAPLARHPGALRIE